MKTTVKLFAILVIVFAGATVSHADITTGWTNTVGGVQQFLDSANWVDGDVNGIFPAGWATGTENGSALTLRLTNDWTGTIRFLGGINQPVTFAGFNASNTKGEARTISLDGDLVLAPEVSQWTSSKLTFDANIGFNLGGMTRNILGNGILGTKLYVNGSFSNGNLVLDGSGAAMALGGTSAVDGNVVLRPNTTLASDHTSSVTNVKRAKDVELHRATLSVTARNTSDKTQIDALTVTGADAPGVSFLQIVHNNKLAVLEAESLVVTNGGALAVMAADLGASSDATKGSRVLVYNVPPLRGFGTAGTPSAPVLPDVIIGGNATLSTIYNTYGANQPVLATYDETLGVRKLADAETSETVSASEAVNLVVPSATTLTLESDATVNSLQLRSGAYNTASPKITGDVTLSVQSGMILVTAPKDNAKIDVAIDFGATNGHIITAGGHNYATDITKPVYGSRGLVLSKAHVTSWDMTVQPSTGARGFSIETATDADTYTGDTWIQSIVEIKSDSPFLPHGMRSGNTIVNGHLSFGTISINGLYGVGAVRGTTLTVGEDGSNSSFAGTAVLTSALNVSGGDFILDGAVTQGAVDVAAGAALGGSGGITNDVIFADGAKLAVTVADGVASCLTVAGAVTGGPVTVNANVTGSKWRDAQCILRSGEEITATFVKGAGIGSLELRNGGTELWATPKRSGFCIVVQ